MDVPLKPELEQFIDREVKAGRFESPAQVIEAGLARLMLDPPDDIDEQTAAAIEEAEAQIERGEGIPLDEAFTQLRQKHLGR